jgi:hypothetical protein
MRPILSLFLLLAACEAPPVERAEQAEASGDYLLAAQFYTEAAVEAACPLRGQLLLRRAAVEELDGLGSSAQGSIDKAVQHCPDLADARWARAQQAFDAGDRDLALEDARVAAASIPAAMQMVRQVSMDMEAENSVRERARSLVRTLREHLDPALPDETLDMPLQPRLARQVPFPLTLRYAVREEVRVDPAGDRPLSFVVEWHENHTYRGDAAEGGYTLVRHLEVPPLPRGTPLYYRLAMSNQRLPMRFKVNTNGDVLDASWLRDGPNRGMRPEMLKPEIEGMLRRRRLFDPGRDGTRVPGDTWRGEDVRVIDGRPRTLSFDSTAKAWVRAHGIPTLHITSESKGEGYTADEEAWLHPDTAVTVRWRRYAQHGIDSDKGSDGWQVTTTGSLVSVHGGE